MPSQPARTVSVASRTAQLGLLALVAAPTFAADIPREEGDPFRIQLSHSMTRDSNLYRLPDGVEVADLSPGSDGSRDDVISHTSASADGGWELGRQSFALNLNVDANRYADNESLDNTSGNGRADWNWQFGRRWSGQVGGGYGRALSGFVNSRFLQRDVLESSHYHGSARYQLTPHWSLTGKTRIAEGSHDTLARQQDDFETQAATFGIDYLTGRGDQIGVEYRRTQTDFPNELPGNPLFASRRYIDRTANLNLRYAFTVKTSLQGSAGYVWRQYPEGAIGDFAGATWNVALLWEPRAKTRVTVGQWQELKAYLDSESNHFEAQGTRVTVAWLPTSRLTFAFEASEERHDYEGFDPLGFGQPPRQDELRAARVSFSFRPRQMVAFELAYGVERRDSSRALFEFDDRIASAGVRLIF
jgi:hypothetical protein